MSYEEMSKEELLSKIASLEKHLASFKEANTDLSMQLVGKDAEMIKIKRELEEQIAMSIKRDNLVKKSTDHYESLVANIPGAVYRCANDAFWTMEYFSEQIEELSGYPASDFVKNHVRSFNSIIHPDDQIKVVDAVNRGLRNMHPYHIQYRILHRDGSIVPVYERGAGVYDEEGELLWLDGVIFDFVNTKLVDGGML
ncbi:MAG: hypothetical protein C0600_00750 [Ignavibacteria bacterium]|nr:MAG: hypothetical protein C0600_00750 [Ignavibacteria bacterium]